MGCGGAADEDAIPDLQRARKAADLLPDAATVDTHAVRPSRHRRRGEKPRHGVEVVRQVAGRGEEGRLAVFVAAIARRRAGEREGRLQRGAILLVEDEREEPGIVGAVLALAEAGADDRRGDGRLVEHPARGNIGQRRAVLRRGAVERGQNALEDGPSADGIDETLVLHPAPIGEIGRLGRAKPAARQEAAGQRAIGEQADGVGAAERAHHAGRAAVEHREGDLVRDDRDALADQNAQMVGVEIGDPDMADQPLLAQPLQFVRRVEISEMIERPPMELEEVDRLDAEAPQTLLDAGANDGGRHRPRLRAPFGEGDRAPAPGRALARQEPAGDQFGRAIMVGHVERVEAVADIGGKVVRRLFRVERRAPALHVGDLPQAGDDSADREAGRELGPLRTRHGGHQPPIFALRALTSSVDISPTVVTLPSVIFHRRNGPVMSPYLSKATGPMTPS